MNNIDKWFLWHSSQPRSPRGVFGHVMQNQKVASCKSYKTDRDNCCQRNRSGGNGIAAIRNTMHKLRLHQRAFMANGINVKSCRLQVKGVFSPDLSEKSQVWTVASHSIMNCTWMNDLCFFPWKTHFCVSSLEKHIFIWANTGKTNNMPPRETKGCAQWCHTLQADLVPSGPNPASAEPTWCKPKITFFGHQLPRPPPIQHNQKWKRCTHFQMFFDHFFASE